LAPQLKRISKVAMDKRKGDGSIQCAVCSTVAQPPTFFVVEKQEEDDPEVGDEDVPFIPYKTYLCPECFKGATKEFLQGARITVPFKPREPDKLVPLPKPQAPKPVSIPPRKGGLFA